MLRQNLGWTYILEEWRPHAMPPTPEQAGRQAIDIFRSLVAENPSDPFARDDLVWALWRIARYLDPVEAIEKAVSSTPSGKSQLAVWWRSIRHVGGIPADLANALCSSNRSICSASNPTRQPRSGSVPFRVEVWNQRKSIWADMMAGRPDLPAERPGRPDRNAR